MAPGRVTPGARQADTLPPVDRRDTARAAAKIGVWILVIGAVVAVYAAFAGVVAALF